MRRRFVLIVFVIVGCQIASLAQGSIDSVNQALARTKDIQRRIYLHSLLGYYYAQRNENDSALHHYYKVWANRSIAPTANLAETANAIGAIYSVKDVHDSTLWYYEQALLLYDELDDSLSYHFRANLGTFYKDIGLYQKSLDVCFQLVEKLENKSVSRELASALSTIGLVYNQIDEDSASLEFHQKALSARRQLGLSSVRHSYNNLGLAYLHLGKSDSALTNLHKSLELKKSANDLKGLPVTLNNIGKALMLTNRTREAKNYFIEALAIRPAAEDRIEYVITLHNLAETFMIERSYDEADRYLKEAEDMAREIGSLAPLAETLDIKVRLLKRKHNFPAAVAALEELLIIRDSLLSIEKVKDVMALEIRYEAEKKAAEILALTENQKISQAALEARERWITTLAILAILLIVVATLVFILLRTTRKSKTRVETLLKELHHRVKNNLQILSSLLILQSHELTDEKAVEAVKTSEGRVNAMALIHKKLYNTDQNREINLREYINELVRDLVHSYGFANRELKLDLQIEEIQLDVDKAIPLGLIINELVSNAFKHAFTDTAHPELKVNVSLREKKVLVLQLSDNGSNSTSVNIDDASSFGLRMVKMLTQDLHGTLSISNTNGAGFSLNIPVTQ